MTETYKTLDLLNALSGIQQRIEKSDAILGVNMTNVGPFKKKIQVQIEEDDLQKLKKMYKLSTNLEEHGDKYIRETAVVFGNVEAFCLIDIDKYKLAQKAV